MPCMETGEILCEDCTSWRETESRCVRGFATEPLWFRFCFLTEGHRPADGCTGPFPRKFSSNPE